MNRYLRNWQNKALWALIGVLICIVTPPAFNPAILGGALMDKLMKRS